MVSPITITITDTNLLSELSRYGNSDDQQQTALIALRLGLQALSAARGEIDLQTLQQASQEILAEVKNTIDFTLKQQTDIFQRQFSFDHPDSVVSRLRSDSNRQHAELQTTIGKYFDRKQMERRSTQGGSTYEELVGNVFSSFVAHTGDILEPTGTLDGKVLRSRIGDFVITLNEDCAAAGERVVVEAKRDQSYTQQKIWSECKDACKNRDAQVAIFVWDRLYGEVKQQPPLMRQGNFIVALWDAEDSTTDIYLKAAFWLARGLVIPKTTEQRVAQVRQQLVEDAFAQLLSLGELLEEIKKSADDIGKKSQKIVNSAVRIHAMLDAQIEDLQVGLNSLH
jgi:hypothetical protein